ncbi:phosphoribosyltransferase [Candidatus Nitrosotalea bavarica]|jgi:hypoxanthine phosphoribosyltransferase|uniref:phosphoribosyltransferase n=1 Tax=Candidatus Nitrosotalea bavarica TaxID=1903277 RepID=UPI000C6FD2AC|nr:phosphoribosyltransferase [Candidatus Nitrosotalea bavarica]
MSWSEIESCVEILSAEIKKTRFEFDAIATISRGGLVPARLIADHFNIKKILVDRNVIPKRTLFVDDIYDSGTTFEKIIPLVKDPKNFVYATLVARKGAWYPKQLVYAKKTRGQEYVVFPWDKLESQVAPKSAKD